MRDSRSPRTGVCPSPVIPEDIPGWCPGKAFFQASPGTGLTIFVLYWMLLGAGPDEPGQMMKPTGLNPVTCVTVLMVKGRVFPGTPDDPDGQNLTERLS